MPNNKLKRKLRTRALHGRRFTIANCRLLGPVTKGYFRENLQRMLCLSFCFKVA